MEVCTNRLTVPVVFRKRNSDIVSVATKTCLAVTDLNFMQDVHRLLVTRISETEKQEIHSPKRG
jgi:hypothetical protein